MKKIVPNIMFILLGAIILSLEFYFMINGILGWLLTSIGIILVGIDIFKGNNPLKSHISIHNLNQGSALFKKPAIFIMSIKTFLFFYTRI